MHFYSLYEKLNLKYIVEIKLDKNEIIHQSISA